MSGVETRSLSRDSLFLMAELRLKGQEASEQVKVRNLSAGGMMAEGGPSVCAGMKLSIKLRNIDWIEGAVAWVQDNRFGIAFVQEIDPKLPRAPVGTHDLAAPRFVRTAGVNSAYDPSQKKSLRKI
ncbi:MAG: PilZ domain-containing protein [Alteripontixanthobacter sp.]